MTRPTYLSLFSGIGGLDLGLERAGWECIGQVEIDPFCQRVLAKHWPDVPRWGDIKELEPDDLPRADLIAGGFPCQPISQNGHQLAQADPRWLWPQMARIVRALRPSYVLVENVADLVARGMGDVLRDLAEIGFDAEWECLPASAVGAPHRRERVFIVAYADGLGPEAGTRLLTRDALACGGQPQTWRSVPRRGTGGRVRPVPDNFVQLLADGNTDGLDHVGNAVVPQVAELIGRRILEADAA